MIFKEDLTATKQPFVFITYRRYRKYVKGKLSKIGLTVVPLLPVLNNIKVFRIFDFKNVCIKVVLQAINRGSRIFGVSLVSYFTALMSLGRGIDF